MHLRRSSANGGGALRHCVSRSVRHRDHGDDTFAWHRPHKGPGSLRRCDALGRGRTAGDPVSAAPLVAAVRDGPRLAESIRSPGSRPRSVHDQLCDDRLAPATRDFRAVVPIGDRLVASPGRGARWVVRPVRGLVAVAAEGDGRRRPRSSVRVSRLGRRGAQPTPAAEALSHTRLVPLHAPTGLPGVLPDAVDGTGVDARSADAGRRLEPVLLDGPAAQGTPLPALRGRAIPTLPVARSLLDPERAGAQRFVTGRRAGRRSRSRKEGDRA